MNAVMEGNPGKWRIIATDNGETPFLGLRSVRRSVHPSRNRTVVEEEGPDTDLAQTAGSVGRPLPRLAEQGEAVAVATGKAEELGRRGGGGIYP